jgi:hypothetical protein
MHAVVMPAISSTAGALAPAQVERVTLTPALRIRSGIPLDHPFELHDGDFSSAG